jgi:hypothetical protein
MTMINRELPVAILGAGPVGLAAAAHLVSRGLEPLIFEAASDVAASLRDWGHVRLFSPWRYNVDAMAARLLVEHGWSAPPPEELPTGDELYRAYLRPLANLPQIRRGLLLGRRVVSVSRLGLDKIRTSNRGEVPFLIRTTGSRDEEFTAGAVIDATGTWWSPNPLGAAGLPAIGEAPLEHRIHYGIPDILGRDRARYAGRATLVVGAGHSAANSILALAQLSRSEQGTTILWATRGSNLARVFGGDENDQLAARGQIGQDLRQLVEQGRLTTFENFRISAVSEAGSRLEVGGTRNGEPFRAGPIDAIIASTGQRPDLNPLREVRLALDPGLECAAKIGPLIDPNEHSCGTVRPHGARELAHPEPNFYIIGSKSYGRAPTFLLATGYEQARSVAAMLAGDEEAALRVELDLPETGVCSLDLARADAGACCASTPQASEATVPPSCGPTGCSPPASTKSPASCC